MSARLADAARAVVIVLLIMSMYSIAVMIERYWTFKKATDQSRKFAPEAARLLKQGKIKEAIDAAHGPAVKYSHLAKVLGPGLQEWQYQQESGEVDRDKDAAGDAAHPARHRGEPGRPEARALGPRDHRLHRSLRGPLRHHLRDHQRLLGDG